MKKQAYLVLAHKNDFTFHHLLQALDDVRNDIFIHMDKKTNQGYSEEEIRNLVKKSNVYFTKRIDVHWASVHQIEAEMELLKLSTQTNSYMYYHLISGEDFPVKSQSEIYNFFKNNQGKEFVAFDSEKFNEKLYGNRVYQYHIVQNIWDRRKPLLFKFYRKIDKLLGNIQNLMGIRRNKNIQFQKGANWFSITDGFARYIVSKENWIYKTFKKTCFTDEMFVQTLLVNSVFKDNLYYKGFDNNYISIVRYIDWNRGGPYVFRLEDYQELISSNFMFARKFDCKIDKNIILKLESHIKE